MPLADTVKRHLAAHPARYRVRSAESGETSAEQARAAGIPEAALARAVLLKTGELRLLAVIPASHEVDLEALQQIFRRRFSLCTEQEAQAAFPDCEPDALPPFGLAYGVKTIVDQSLDRLDEAFFATGVPGRFVRAGIEDFRRLLGEAWRGAQVAHSNEVPASSTAVDIRREIERVDRLPAMPGIAAQIIQVRNNPFANASELSAVIEQDPSLAAQLIRYARSPFYGYQGKVESVETAIVRVLGMDFVLDFAFGLSLGRSLRNPRGGPLGLDNFWEHSLEAAALTQALCNEVEYAQRPWPGTAYLAGLLHNFGLLLLGHLFPEEFERLNDAVAEQPERPLQELEQELFGIDHTEIGEHLMGGWEMPRELVEAVRYHHDPAYRSDFGEYANLVCIANRLLYRNGWGDERSTELPAQLLRDAGLTEARAEAALNKVLTDREGLAFMARKMAA